MTDITSTGGYTCPYCDGLVQGNEVHLCKPVRSMRDPVVFERQIAQLLAAVDAINNEVKRLTGRKVCTGCGGRGDYMVLGELPGINGNPPSGAIGQYQAICEYCNGTGYIESEDK